jgi:hypothetical protein
MTNIYNKTETDTSLNAKQNTLTAATNLVGIGSSITNINYATLLKVPSTFPANMTNIYNKTETETIANSLWTSNTSIYNWVYLNKPFTIGRVGIGINDLLTGVLELCYDFNPNASTTTKIKFGCRSANANSAANQLFSSRTFRVLSSDPNNLLFAVGYMTNYDDPAPRTYIFDMTRTALTMTGDGSFGMQQTEHSGGWC